MIVRKLRVLTAGVLFLFAAGAQAQGHTLNPWYFALGGGGTWYNDWGISGGPDIALDTGYNVSGAFGRYIDDIRVFRLELEALYTHADVDNVGGTKSTGTLTNTGLMFNAMYDIRTNSNWLPYFGGGIGYSQVDMDNLATGGVVLINDHDNAFSWQVKAGVAYELSESWVIDVNYRYYATGNLTFDSTVPGGAPTKTEGTGSSNAAVEVRFHF